MVRRINLFGGPGCGKSTLAAHLFARLKMSGYDVEHVSEYIKTWVYEGRKPQSYDQLYVFSKQLKAEDINLRNVDLLVTDSPLLLNVAYSLFYGFQVTDQLAEIALQFDRDFPSINLYIERTIDYVDKGRYHTESEAEKFDKHLIKFLESHLPHLTKINVNDLEDIYSEIELMLYCEEN